MGLSLALWKYLYSWGFGKVLWGWGACGEVERWAMGGADKRIPRGKTNWSGVNVGCTGAGTHSLRIPASAYHTLTTTLLREASSSWYHWRMWFSSSTSVVPSPESLPWGRVGRPLSPSLVPSVATEPRESSWFLYLCFCTSVSSLLPLLAVNYLLLVNDSLD